MTIKYVNLPNSPINYIGISTDNKSLQNGNVGAILYVYDTQAYFVNVDGAVNWQPYLAPKLTT